MIAVLYSFLPPEIPGDVWNRYFTQLPENERKRVLSYHRQEDRDRRLFGGHLIARTLAHLGYPFSALERIQCTEYGRPLLGDDTDFNLSHSGKGIVCAAGCSVRVGIDLEIIRPIEMEDFQDVFQPAAWLDIHHAADSLAMFFTHWTKNESVIKADGRGWSAPLREIRWTHSSLAKLDQTEWYVTEIPLYPGYICHLAANRRDLKIERIPVDFFADLASAG